MENSDFNKEHHKETYKSLITISTEAIKALIFVNGGAAAGMVAALEKLTAVVPTQAIKNSMICFVVGLTLAIGSLFLAYLTQCYLHEQNMNRDPNGIYKKWRLATFIAATSSLALFCAGGLMMALNAGAV